MNVAPLVVLDQSAQARDIRTSRGPSRIYRHLYRVKQYVKDEDLSYGACPRALAFDQPYQLAAQLSGCDWNQGNRAFLGQLRDCNLDCPYCYASKGKEQASELVTAEQYWRAYWDYCDAAPPESRPGVLRVTGGEPMLYQEWVAEVVNQAEDFKTLVWVDTNLTLLPSAVTLSALMSPYAAVCGCFKPGVATVDLDAQLAVAEEYIRAGVNIFFYYPSWGDWDQSFQSVLDGLYRISPCAVLRLTVIYINWGYAVVGAKEGGELSPDSKRVLGEQSVVGYRDRRGMLTDVCVRRFPASYQWLPSHQVGL